MNYRAIFPPLLPPPNKMIVIADTTPIITLLKIGHFDILRDLYKNVHIPRAVFRELTENSDYVDEALAVRRADFLIIRDDISAEKVDLLRRATGLDQGESEAIILADTNETKVLIIDESHGRAVAEQMNIKITGVIGVLIAAYKKNLLSDTQIKESVDVMRQSNRFISETLYKLLLSIIEK